MSFSKMSNFKQRLTISGIGIAFLLVIIYLSPYPYFRPVFALFIAGIIGASVWEYFHLAKAKGYQPLDAIGIVCAVAYAFATFLSTQTPQAKLLPQIILWLTLFSLFLHYFIKGNEPLVNLAITLFGIAYLAIPLSCAININYFFPSDSLQDGRWWLVYLLVVTKVTDTGAYFCGKKFGRRKFAPFISPKKTWEGAIGGFIAAVISSVLLFMITFLYYRLDPLGITLWQSIWLGALISIIAQFGDLAESLLKRDVGVKDSNQLPGLGGTLDIVDSLVFTLPLMYIFIQIK